MPNPETFKTHEDYLEWYRTYRLLNAPKIREYKREYIKEYRKKHGMIKDNARSKLNSAILSDKIVRKPCEFCGEEKSEGHHINYDWPLTVIWVCRKCHCKLHK